MKVDISEVGDVFSCGVLVIAMVVVTEDVSSVLAWVKFELSNILVVDIGVDVSVAVEFVVMLVMEGVNDTFEAGVTLLFSAMSQKHEVMIIDGADLKNVYGIIMDIMVLAF